MKSPHVRAPHLLCLLAALLAGPMVPAHAAQDSRAAAPAAAAPAARADLAGTRASTAVRQVADWVVGSADNGGLPFIVLDKVNAKVFVFEPDGRLRGAAPVLLGFARGDHTVPDIGSRKIADILPHERTTPAGRFVAEMGMSSSRGEDVVWVDYDSGVSMHRVIKGKPNERRAERLASPTAKDNRISYGCINVPVAFYEQQLSAAVKRRGKAIVYVLPETRPAGEVFGFAPVAAKTAPRKPPPRSDS